MELHLLRRCCSRRRRTRSWALARPGRARRRPALPAAYSTAPRGELGGAPNLRGVAHTHHSPSGSPSCRSGSDRSGSGCGCNSSTPPPPPKEGDRTGPGRTGRGQDGGQQERQRRRSASRGPCPPREEQAKEKLRVVVQRAVAPLVERVVLGRGIGLGNAQRGGEGRCGRDAEGGGDHGLCSGAELHLRCPRQRRPRAWAPSAVWPRARFVDAACRGPHRVSRRHAASWDTVRPENKLARAPWENQPALRRSPRRPERSRGRPRARSTHLPTGLRGARPANAAPGTPGQRPHAVGPPPLRRESFHAQPSRRAPRRAGLGAEGRSGTRSDGDGA